MPGTIIKSRLHLKKHKPKTKQELINTKSNLPHTFVHLNKIYYQVMILLCLNELRRFSFIR